MNTEVQVKWCDAALATPPERRVMGRLTAGNEDGTVSHCMLGVLYQLAHDEGVINWDGYGNGDRSMWLSITAWADLHTTRLPSIRSSIITANDTGIPWEVIVDAIKNDL